VPGGVGAAAIGVADVSAVGGYLVRQADDALRACAAGMLGHGLVAVPGSGPAPGRAMPGACGVELRSAGGRLLIPAAPAAPGPAIPASGSRLAEHLAQPVTVPGAGGGGHWRAVIVAVRYQPQRMLYVYGPDDLRYVISGPAGPGSSGMLIVMTPLAGTGPGRRGLRRRGGHRAGPAGSRGIRRDAGDPAAGARGCRARRESRPGRVRPA